MKECHKCPVAAEIESGKWKATPWAKTPCSTCVTSGTEHLTNRGRTHVPFDDAFGPDADHNEFEEPLLEADRIKHFTPGDADPELDPDHPVFDGHAPRTPHSNHLDPSVQAMSFIAKSILGLQSGTRELVLDRIAYPSRPIRVTAERLGISISSAHDRLKRARESWPALSWAIPMKSWTWTLKPAPAKTHRKPRKPRKTPGKKGRSSQGRRTSKGPAA